MNFKDEFTFIPVEDIIHHPICKAFKWDQKIIRKKIREGFLEGKMNTRGEAYLTLAELQRVSFLHRINLVLENGVMEAAANGDPSTDYAYMVLESLINQLFGIRGISMKKLKEVIKAAQL